MSPTPKMDKEPDKFFDYKIVSTCQFPVYSYRAMSEEDCREPAPYRVWWTEHRDDWEDYIEEMYLCETHFNFVAVHEGGKWCKKYAKIEDRDLTNSEKSL